MGVMGEEGELVDEFEVVLWTGGGRIEDDSAGAAQLVTVEEVEAFGDEEVRDVAVEEGGAGGADFGGARVPGPAGSETSEIEIS